MMNQIPRQKLIELVSDPRFGIRLCEDAQLCRGLLNDVCGGQFKKEISGLVTAVVERAASELSARSHAVPLEVMITRLSKRLHDNVGLAEELALWSVQSWALALGMPDIEKSEVNELQPVSLQSSIDTGPASKESAASKTLVLDLGGGVEMELVLVKAGNFEMGNDDADASDSEKPVHSVKITHPFYIGKCPITVAQFKRFVTVTGTKTDAEKDGKALTLVNKNWLETDNASWRNPGFSQDDDHPVVLVSWNDAQAFVKWVCAQTNMMVNFPSEAQWEYAARGPENWKFPWGNAWDGMKANHADQTLKNSGKAGDGWIYSDDTDGFVFTNPVGTIKNASWCGAFDMSGNVWQWCHDTYDSNFYVSSQISDPINVAQGTNRVLRGGSWANDPRVCRSSYREIGTPNERSPFVGFRVVADGPVERPFDTYLTGQQDSLAMFLRE